MTEIGLTSAVITSDSVAAKCLARNTLTNLLPRNPNEREQEPNNTQSNSHSTSEASNEPGQRIEKRSVTSQGLDKGPSLSN